ncbi:MAG: hypothetical protein NTU83_13415 [Candidatus Hydrogenedentes bacterium]|nr:hypothetical protein [Candidatus Hydrogenedentota bacterium]
MLTLLFAAAFFAWTTGAMAEIAFLGVANGTMRSAEPDNPVPHATPRQARVADPLALLVYDGNYPCAATDDTGAYESPEVNVKILAPGQLPAMGIVGLCLVVVACVVAGALIILRRE